MPLQQGSCSKYKNQHNSIVMQGRQHLTIEVGVVHSVTPLIASVVTELMWAGTRYSVANLLCDHNLSLTLGTEIVKATDVIRVLGVLFTSDLMLEKQVTSVSAKCFFQLRQLQHVRHSLDRDSVATLVHAFVTSRIGL